MKEGKGRIGVVGAGSMGSGIAQLAATYGHSVHVCESSPSAVENSRQGIDKVLSRLAEKGSITTAEKGHIQNRISYSENLEDLRQCSMIIEAIVEDLRAKKKLFSSLDTITGDDCILATNTSSLSVSAIGSACAKDFRVVGMHFFNPPPLMPLVEIIPSLSTTPEVLRRATEFAGSWEKSPVIAKDSPGFIVNRIARPYYGEAIRIYEEGIADIATIDYAMKARGFRMGPFELMDYIGNDINYTVTETIFREFYYDPRYKPSFTQKRMYESGRLGRKSGIGYYDYRKGAENPKPDESPELALEIFSRIIYMLINEAADALYLKIASREDIETAMTRGVNYPKGLLKWADEIGISKIFGGINDLSDKYREDRYRPSVLLRKMAESGETFF